MSNLTQKIRESRAERQRVERRLGKVPLSVINFKGIKPLPKPLLRFGDANPQVAGASRNLRKCNTSGKHGDATWHKGYRSAEDAGGANAELTEFTPKVVDFFIQFYGVSDGGTFLDPFAGRGVPMQVAAMRGMDYVGFDCCVKWRGWMDALVSRLGTEYPDRLIEYHCADSRVPAAVEDRSGDFCFTSPPYWRQEKYGDEPEQLGRLDYDDFVTELGTLFAAWRFKFKPSAYVVVNVADFVDSKGVFRMYHSDVHAVMVANGYKPHDMWVLTDTLANTARIFAMRLIKAKKAPRVHEYAMVYRPG